MTQPVLGQNGGNLFAQNPYDAPAAWDKVRLGGVWSPGLCTWSGWERKSEWDKKRGKGVKGTTTTLKQLPECEGSFTFHIGFETLSETPQDQYAQWDNFSPLLAVDASKKSPTALDIVHPALATLIPPVTAVFVEEVGPITPDGDGGYSVTVKFSEFLPVTGQNIVATPNTSQSPGGANAPGAQPPPAQNALVAQLAALLKKAQET